MLSLTYTAALLLGMAALAAGFLLGWVHFQLRTGAHFIPVARHSDELLSMRRRYRRRLRAVRDAQLRHKLGEERLRDELQAALSREAGHARSLAAAGAENDSLRTRLGDAEGRVEVLKERAHSMDAQLATALRKLAAFESEHGLLRIERDELVARTQRLRALPAAAPADSPEEVASSTSGNATRAELADRDARIHELECQLRESANRVGELESNLHTWKYRIAPLALHLKLQRERARQRTGNDAAPVVEQPPDDLKRIRGIGRGLEKKLRAEGIRTFAQLAEMSPAELANLAIRVGLAASRPVRDRWADQARQCCPGGDPVTDAARAEAG
jgi:predicted flap endonuclease-1-like 5' DNA nuclease